MVAVASAGSFARRIHMALNHSRPNQALAEELAEVAEAATDMLQLIQRGLNAPLPNDFPRDQLLDICRSLALLPEGTAEGCRVTLEYARSRLARIRREHIVFETAVTGSPDKFLTRGATLDQRLATLISSVTTSLHAYWGLAGEEDEEELITDAGLASSVIEANEAFASTKSLDSSLAEAKRTVDAVLEKSSSAADDFKRQLQDAQNINKMGSAEVRMPKVVPELLRKTFKGLRDYPEIIRRSADGLQLGADVVELFYARWHEFKHNGFNFIFDEFRKTTKSLESLASLLERKRKGGSSSKSVTIEDADLVFLPQSATIKALRAFTEIRTSPGQARAELSARVGRNELRDLFALGLVRQVDAKIYPVDELSIDPEIMIMRAAAATPSIKFAHKMLAANPNVDARDLGAALGAALGKEWSNQSTRKRYGNAIRKWAIWLTPHLIDPRSSSNAAALVAAAKSREYVKGPLRKMTPELLSRIKVDLESSRLTVAAIAKKYDISASSIANNFPRHRSALRGTFKTLRGRPPRKLP